ncbi:MAG: PaREP1 family protein [Ignisphaera sp.]
MAHITLAEKHLEEGRNLIDGDPVQAGEKLYKAAEECVKALALYLNLEEIVAEAEERGRWTVTELEKAVLRAAQKIGEWILSSWNHAWALHV